MWLLLAAILAFMLILEELSAHGPTEATGALGFLLCTLLAAPILLAVAAKLVRHGWAVGWLFALIAELNIGVLLYASIDFGLFFGLPIVILVGIAIWVIVNLLRGEALRFFFNRRSRTQAVALTDQPPRWS
jgi:predicted lipid-binding transport protein (Tim44 family)